MLKAYYQRREGQHSSDPHWCVCGDHERKSRGGSFYALCRDLIDAGHDPAETIALYDTKGTQVFEENSLAYFALWTCSEGAKTPLRRVKWQPFEERTNANTAEEHLDD